jgi:hypothetical protein
MTPPLILFNAPPKIYWNDVYRRKLHRQALAELRIAAHYLRKDYLLKANYGVLSFVLIPT